MVLIKKLKIKKKNYDLNQFEIINDVSFFGFFFKFNFSMNSRFVCSWLIIENYFFADFRISNLFLALRHITLYW